MAQSTSTSQITACCTCRYSTPLASSDRSTAQGASSSRATWYGHFSTKGFAASLHRPSKRQSGDTENSMHPNAPLAQPKREEGIASSPKRLARIAGVFYLLVGIFVGFAEGFVDPKLYVAGDAAATTANVLANSVLVRMGVLAHLADGAFFALTALTLYVLLKHVHQSVARAMLVFVVIAVGMISLNAVFQFEGLQVATDGSYATAFGAAGSNAIVMILIEIQHFGTLAAQVFFGLWLRALGYLAIKSAVFPRAPGRVLGGATVSYLVDLLAAFSSPGLAQQIHPVL